MAEKYLTFDLGASSGRAIICTLNDGKLELNEVHRFVNGPLEKNGTLYWDFPTICEEIKTGLKKALLNNPDINGIAVDTWGVDYVLFDRSTGKIKRLPYHYRDSRVNNVIDRVFKKISKRDIYKRTGIQFMSLNTLYQLAAHNEQYPEDFDNAIMLFMPDALTNYLNGELTCEYSIASTSNLLDPVKRDWDFELIRELGLPEEIFPPLVAPSTLSAPLKRELQVELGCGAIPVIRVGAHDTASAVAAVPAYKENSWAYISCGTWALLGAEIDNPLLTPEAEVAPYTNEGGLENKIRFLTNIMGTWLLQETKRKWHADGKDLGFPDMALLAADAQPLKFFIDPNDALFVAPGNIPERICEYCSNTGQGTPANDGEILRCIYDSLALCFRDKLVKLENILDVKYDMLNIVGGGTKDTLLMQLAADSLGIPVLAGPVEATAIGNALSQAIASGKVKNLESAREIIRNSFEIIKFIPDGNNKAAWDAGLQKFRAVCDQGYQKYGN